ncbi:MAG: TetR/AcrR family transcriptional regulator [Chitinispirillaceae bacterium]|nr:TetR/AcrR family transcriptional regulator [Chitinispirillaceae bacterium]
MDPKVIREQAIRDAKTNLILDAARTVFSQTGFFEARLEDIATAAGFSKAALYSYYTDKEEIFLSLAIRDLENLYNQLESRVDPSLSFLKNLETMLSTIFTFFGENFSLLLSISNFQTMCKIHKEKMSDKHKILVAELPLKFRKIMEQQVALIKSARVRGEIDSPVDDIQLAHYLSALVRGIIFQWQLSGKMGDVTQEIGQLLKFVENGLGCSIKTGSAEVHS